MKRSLKSDIDNVEASLPNSKRADIPNPLTPFWTFTATDWKDATVCDVLQQLRKKSYDIPTSLYDQLDVNEHTLEHHVHASVPADTLLIYDEQIYEEL